MTRRAWSRAIRVAFSLALLGVLALVMDIDAIAARMSALDGAWVLGALGVSVGQVLLSAWRWRFTADRLGLRLSLSGAVREYYLATFLNQILPGGVLGDVGRAWRHASAGGLDDDKATPVSFRRRAVHAVILERLSGQIVMIAVACVSIGVLLEGRAPLFGGAVAVGLLIVLRSRRTDRLPTGAAFATSGRTALIDGVALPIQLTTSLVVVASYLLVFLMAARSIGVTVPAATLAPLIAPVLVAMLMPVTVAGWGVREAAAAWLWSVAGLDPSDGVAISLTYGLLVLVSSAPGAALLAATTWRHADPDRTARPPPEGRSGREGAVPPPGWRPAEE